MIDRGELIRKAAMNVIHLSGLPHITGPSLSGIGAILMLHRVTNEPGSRLGLNRHLTVSPDFLELTIDTVRKAGYDLVSMDEAVSRINGAESERPFAAITFDDGYRDNLHEALPVLERHEAPFTIYIAPGLIDGNTLLWWDVIEQIVERADTVTVPGPQPFVLDCATPRQKVHANCVITEHLTGNIAETGQTDFVREMSDIAGIDAVAHRRALIMDWEEITEIAAHRLCTIGAHSLNHYNLRRLDDETARAEIIEGKAVVEKRLGSPIRHLAYPYGYASAAGEREAELARQAGFDSAVTTRHGVIHREHARHMHALPRISINGRYQERKYLQAMLSGITGVISNAGRRVTTY